MLLNKLKSLYHKIDLSECAGKEDREQQLLLAHIHILIEGSKAEANKNAKKAQEYYQIADKLIQRQLDKFCKHCK